MTIHFDEEANAEVDSAIAHYEMERAGCGNELAAEIKASLLRIVANPELCGHVTKDIRRCRLHRFPYDLLYSVEGERIEIIAFSHHHRRPGYWKGRLR